MNFKPLGHEIESLRRELFQKLISEEEAWKESWKKFPAPGLKLKTLWLKLSCPDIALSGIYASID